MPSQTTKLKNVIDLNAKFDTIKADVHVKSNFVRVQENINDEEHRTHFHAVNRIVQCYDLSLFRNQYFRKFFEVIGLKQHVNSNTKKFFDVCAAAAGELQFDIHSNIYHINHFIVRLNSDSVNLLHTFIIESFVVNDMI